MRGKLGGGGGRFKHNSWWKLFPLFKRRELIRINWINAFSVKSSPDGWFTEVWSPASLGLPRWLGGKESACQCRRHGFDPWVGKIPWRRVWQPTPVFWPGESHGQRCLVGYSPQDCKELDTTEHQRTDAFELLCWRRLLRVPWTARRSNQSILK